LEQVKVEGPTSFVKIFSVLKNIKDQKIILVFDELDKILDVKEKESDEFLISLRSLKNDPDKHNIQVLIIIKVVNYWNWSI
jgi:Cdc6-like AAA superfamily ATPase